MLDKTAALIVNLQMHYIDTEQTSVSVRNRKYRYSIITDRSYQNHVLGLPDCGCAERHNIDVAECAVQSSMPESARLTGGGRGAHDPQHGRASSKQLILVIACEANTMELHEPAQISPETPPTRPPRGTPAGAAV